MARKGKAPLASGTIKRFSTALEFRGWLTRQHTRDSPLLLRIYKKGSGVRSISYAEALDQALCFGWIDGIKLAYDDAFWQQNQGDPYTDIFRRTKAGWRVIFVQVTPLPAANQ